MPVHSTPNYDTNVNGTNECSFLDTKVTSVVYNNGSTSTIDELVNASIVDNEGRPFAKMIDIDVDIQGKSTIHGMTFGIRIPEGDSFAFKGNWVPNVVSQDYWLKVKCYGPHYHGSHPFDASFALGAQATTVIKNVSWDSFSSFTILNQLKEASEKYTGDLAVRMSFYFYTRSYIPFLEKNFTLAYIVGSIGIAYKGEPLNFGGERILVPGRFDPPGLLAIDEHDSCYNKKLGDFSPWLFKAPFKVDSVAKKLTVDLSNSLPINMYGTIRNIGPIQFGVLLQKSTQYPEFCVYTIGENIPYLANNWLESTSGIVTYSLDDYQLSDLKVSKLVVIQTTEESETSTFTAPFCGGPFPSLHESHLAQILIEEAVYFIRPLNYYVDRLEYKETSKVTLLVTEYGQPVERLAIEMKRSNPSAHPIDGIVANEWIVETNEKGHAEFSFRVQEPIPYPRKYSEPPCPGTPNTTLPIDGQVYLFKYCVESDCPPNTKFLFVPEITFLVFSTIVYTEPYTWVDHVEPLFRQYHHLNKAMRSILNLSDYHSVTLPQNIQLVNLSMTLDFDHPNYMPVTRDLSPTNHKMILKWLMNPLYSKDYMEYPSQTSPLCQHPETTSIAHESFDIPPRCKMDLIPFNSHPFDTDPYFLNLHDGKGTYHLRPLQGYSYDPSKTNAINNNLCTIENVNKQLQIALHIKLHTIPLYLTSLYSIVKGCNTHVANVLLEISKREMIHLVQTANLLRAFGEVPKIDKEYLTPVFPTTGFPGGVLNNLSIDLKKASLQHIYKLFMSLNLPQYRGNSLGIENIFDEVRHCLEFMKINNKDDFVFEQNNEQFQIHWISHESNTIRNWSEALAIIESIMDLNTHSNYSFFYQLEEIVCQRKYVAIDEDYYTYSGNPIPFDIYSVWQMVDNPNWSDIQKNTNCYTQARVFHQVYQKVLSKIQESFNGNSSTFFEALQLMKSLHIHFKKVIWTELGSKDSFSCGPVWDYRQK